MTAARTMRTASRKTLTTVVIKKKRTVVKEPVVARDPPAEKRDKKKKPAKAEVLFGSQSGVNPAKVRLIENSDSYQLGFSDEERSAKTRHRANRIPPDVQARLLQCEAWQAAQRKAEKGNAPAATGLPMRLRPEVEYKRYDPGFGVKNSQTRIPGHQSGSRALVVACECLDLIKSSGRGSHIGAAASRLRFCFSRTETSKRPSGGGKKTSGRERKVKDPNGGPKKHHLIERVWNRAKYLVAKARTPVEGFIHLEKNYKPGTVFYQAYVDLMLAKFGKGADCPAILRMLRNILGEVVDDACELQHLIACVDPRINHGLYLALTEEDLGFEDLLFGAGVITGDYPEFFLPSGYVGPCCDCKARKDRGKRGRLSPTSLMEDLSSSDDDVDALYLHQTRFE